MVELRLAPEFGAALCAALSDGNGALPVLEVPRTERQLAFWRGRSPSGTSGSGDGTALEAHSEGMSHLETLREALGWYARGQTPGTPLRVFILGASARYEYAGPPESGPVRLAEALAQQLAEVAAAGAPGARVDFLLCGRDVPRAAHGRRDVLAGGSVTVYHQVGYLHDLSQAQAGVAMVRGSLIIVLHSGLGLEHPELSASWPPTLRLLAEASPVWLAVSSFNAVEHAAAERVLRAALPGQLAVDFGGPNPSGSLCGPDAIGPFDGLQGKRNYCLLLARASPPERSAEGWDLFE